MQVPFSPRIWQAAGYAEMARKYGNDFVWGMCPRAMIMRDRAHTVADAASMGHFLRYNDFEHDPLANDDPGACLVGSLFMWVDVCLCACVLCV